MDFEESLRTQDEPGILRSREYFNTLIAEQVEKGISPSRIILGGFSQGGAVSVFSALTNKEKLGGVFGLSCYLVLSDRIKNYIPENWPNRKTPFFLAHGVDDEIVHYEFGDKSAKMLKEMGLEDVTFNSYEYVLPAVLALLLRGADDAVTSATRLIRLRSKTSNASWRRRFPRRVTVSGMLGYDLTAVAMGPARHERIAWFSGYSFWYSLY